MLEADGARLYTQECVNSLTEKALSDLGQAGPEGEAGLALKDLALDLLHRQG